MEVGRSFPLEDVVKWNNTEYSLEATGDQLSLIILGEDHWYAALQSRQAELIRIIKPDVVLYELLTGWSYDPLTGKMARQPGRKFGGLFNGRFVKPPRRNLREDLAAFSNELGIPVVGCDLTTQECRDIFRVVMRYSPGKYEYDSDFRGMIISKDEPFELKAVQVIPEMMPLRNQKMADMAISQVQQGKLTVAVLGAKHGVDIHGGGLLLNYGFNYCFVNQMAPYSLPL